MTAQIPERFLYKGELFDLVGLEGGNLVFPQDFGIEPKALHTACWRGFFSTYEINDEGIFLHTLHVRDKNEIYPIINGVIPKITDGVAIYNNLQIRVPFTGKLRLAKDFIQELYVHMGFQKPSAYQIVLDLLFEEGYLKKIDDLSKEMEAKRGSFKRRYEGGNIVERINEAFSLDLDIE